MQEEVTYTKGITGFLRDCRWRWVFLWFFYNLFVFYATRLINKNWVHWNMETSFDRRIPFTAPWILVYIVLSFGTWYTGFVLLAGEKKETVIRFFSAELIGKTICLIFFLALPTTMDRPEITGNGIFETLTKWIYSADSPDNLFPSIHCMESWILARSASSIRRLGKWYAPAMYITAVFVFLSTLFVKQHVVVDVISAVVTAEIGLFFSRFIVKKYKSKRK